MSNLLAICSIHFRVGFRSCSVFRRKQVFDGYAIANTQAMSTKKSKRISKQVQTAKDEAREDNSAAVIENKDQTVTIKILAKPGARQNAITGISCEGVGVQIAAPPVDGEANTELIRYLSKLLGLRKSDVCLDKGCKSRQKSAVISGLDRNAVEQILLSEIDT